LAEMWTSAAARCRHEEGAIGEHAAIYLSGASEHAYAVAQKRLSQRVPGARGKRGPWAGGLQPDRGEWRARAKRACTGCAQAAPAPICIARPAREFSR
jgi:hypothetical protein